MRYMALLKGSKESEAYVPSKDDAAQMGNYIEAAMKEGWLLATEGLHPSAKAARVQVAGGKRAVTDGPFSESKELIASYALLQVNSKEEAIARTEEFLQLIGGGEIDLWQVYEPTDFR
ncbi:MAG TPA: YciI family protein [Chloroflexota bacterium]|nr:YciI family protein [Chloroflexota bacterium]